MTTFLGIAYIATGFGLIGFVVGFFFGYTGGLKDGIDLGR